MKKIKKITDLISMNQENQTQRKLINTKSREIFERNTVYLETEDGRLILNEK